MWTVILPFLINGLNATVSSSTLFTPAEIFLGRSIENTPIPLLPGDHPEVTSDKWMMAVRRGQEYKYEIIRKRARIAKNKRKEKMNVTRPTHKFTEGNFVMLKDFSPAHQGEKKLRSKWRGPMHIIKAMATTLAVVPWTETMDDIGKLGLPTARFQRRAKGVAGNQPLLYELVSTKNCKPYQGPVGQCLDYDPLFVDRFLHELNNNWELQTTRTFVESEADFRLENSDHGNDPNYQPPSDEDESISSNDDENNSSDEDNDYQPPRSRL
jgi:hypothetical protein